MSLSQEQLIAICQRIAKLRKDYVLSNSHMNKAFYRYAAIAGVMFGYPTAIEFFEQTFAKPVFGDACWVLPAMATYYLSLYGKTKIMKIQGQEPTTFLNSDVYTFVTSKEGMTLWFSWMYHLLNPQSKMPYIEPHILNLLRPSSNQLVQQQQEQQEQQHQHISFNHEDSIRMLSTCLGLPSANKYEE